jgi:hypothetical protein
MLGITKARQLLNKNKDIDLRLNKHRLIEDTNDLIADELGADNVILNTGHSQGAHDSSASQNSHFKKARVINFNPAPGGEVPESMGKVFVTPNDFVSTLAKRLHAIYGSEVSKLVYVRSTGTGLTQTLTGGHLLGTSFAPEAPTSKGGDKVTFTLEEITDAINSGNDTFTEFMAKKGVTNLTTVSVDSDVYKAWQTEYNKLPKNYREKFPWAFSPEELDAIESDFVPEVHPVGSGKGSGVLSSIKGGAAIGVQAGIAAGYDTVGLDPYQNAAATGATYEAGSQGAGAAARIALGTKVETAIMEGMKVAAVDAPIAAGGMVAATAAFEGTDHLMKALNINQESRTIIDSAVSGGVFQVGTDIGKAGVRGAMSGVNALTAGASKAGGEVGIEMTEAAIAKTLTRSTVSIAEEAGVSILAAGMKASMVGAAFGEALTVGMNTYGLFDALAHHRAVTTDEVGTSVEHIVDPFALPIDDPFALPKKVAKVASEGIAHLFGAKTAQEKAEEQRRKAENNIQRYNAVVERYRTTLGDRTMNPYQYMGKDGMTPPESVFRSLSRDDQNLIREMNPQFQDVMERQFHDGWLNFSRLAVNRIRVSNSIEQNVFFTDQKVLDHIKTTDPTFYQMVVDSNKTNQQQQTALHLSESDYIHYLHVVSSGSSPTEEYTRLITNASQNAGYTSPQDYIRDKEAGTSDQLKNEGDDFARDQKFAADYNEAIDLIHPDPHKGQTTLDESQYADHMTDWTPEISQILRAHNLGFSVSQFNQYMRELPGFANAQEQQRYITKSSGVDDGQSKVDYLHLQNDLLYAGYDQNMYNSDFTRDTDVSDQRDKVAAQRREQLGRGGRDYQDIHDAITSSGADHPQMSNKK